MKANQVGTRVKVTSESSSRVRLISPAVAMRLGRQLIGAAAKAEAVKLEKESEKNGCAPEVTSGDITRWAAQAAIEEAVDVIVTFSISSNFVDDTEFAAIVEKEIEDAVAGVI